MFEKERAAPEGCFNCKRHGVAPGQLITDNMGNVFCSLECGWSYLLESPAQQEILRKAPRQQRPSRALQAAREYDFITAQRRQTAASSRKSRSKQRRARAEQKAGAEAVLRPAAPQTLPERRQTVHALFEFHQSGNWES